MPFVGPADGGQWRPQFDVLGAVSEVAVDIAIVDRGAWLASRPPRSPATSPAQYLAREERLRNPGWGATPATIPRTNADTERGSRQSNCSAMPSASPCFSTIQKSGYSLTTDS